MSLRLRRPCEHGHLVPHTVQSTVDTPYGPGYRIDSCRGATILSDAEALRLILDEHPVAFNRFAIESYRYADGATALDALVSAVAAAEKGNSDGT